MLVSVANIIFLLIQIVILYCHLTPYLTKSSFFLKQAKSEACPGLQKVGVSKV